MEFKKKQNAKSVTQLILYMEKLLSEIERIWFGYMKLDPFN